MALICKASITSILVQECFKYRRNDVTLKIDIEELCCVYCKCYKQNRMLDTGKFISSNVILRSIILVLEFFFFFLD